ncbi:MAG: glutathione S-transferase, partial [Comamonas sp.]
MLKLYIGNKNYSSWSMRPWMLMRQSGIHFDEVRLRFDSFAPDSQFKQQVLSLSPIGKVPLLVDDELIIWDSLAICEYLAERFPEKHLWPQHASQRARARSLVSEMHSGFSSLRSLCPMNIEARLHEVGAQLWEQ